MLCPPSKVKKGTLCIVRPVEPQMTTTTSSAFSVEASFHAPNSRGPQPGQTVDTPLSKNEYLIYTIAFLFIPCVNVLVSSILYYIWRAKQPNRANQMNRLGFMVFGAQLLLGILLRLAGLS